MEERDIAYEDLENAYKVFGANSIMGIMKVRKIDDTTYKKDDNFRNIMKKYNDTLIRLGDYKFYDR